MTAVHSLWTCLDSATFITLTKSKSWIPSYRAPRNYYYLTVALYMQYCSSYIQRNFSPDFQFNVTFIYFIADHIIIIINPNCNLAFFAYLFLINSSS